MTRIMPKGCRVAKYTVLEELNRGTNAVAYKAKHDDGRLVFLKQYKCPTRMNPWFDAYVMYEAEKKRRIDHSPAHEYCLSPVDIFEAKYGALTLFQAFEFVENGEDLKAALRRLGTSMSPSAWEQRLLFSKVFLAALHEVSKIGLVHGDLKPENIHLIENREIAAGYRPRLIDMDASLLTDKAAPWHGHTGYTGTPNYFSPEHGGTPTPASDIFTASLILHELLCKVRPYQEYSGASEVTALIKAAPATLPLLRGTLDSPEKDKHLKEVLRDCLSLDPLKRPSIAALRNAVLGKGLPTPSGAKVKVPSSRTTLRVGAGGCKSLAFNINTEFDHSLAKSLDPTTRRPNGTYFSFLRESGEWYVDVGAAANKCTLIRNSARLKGKCKISDGDLLRLEWLAGATPPLNIKVELE